MKCLLLTTLLLVGCATQEVKYKPALEEFTCSPNQMRMVEYEFFVCNQTTYSSEYCFLQAKSTLCTPIREAR